MEYRIMIYKGEDLDPISLEQLTLSEVKFITQKILMDKYGMVYGEKK